MFKKILEFFWYNILDNQEYTDYLISINEINELNYTIRSLRVTITDLKKKDYYELYKQQLVELNRLRACLNSSNKSRDKWEEKCKYAQSRLQEVIWEKARNNYCPKTNKEPK